MHPLTPSGHLPGGIEFPNEDSGTEKATNTRQQS